MEEPSSSALQVEEPEVNLREWNLQVNLLNKIPVKAQKGFQTFDLHLTCIGVISDHIALGTNVGLIYWYNRKQDSLERLKFENAGSSPVTCISVVSCENYMLAAGNRDGLIAIFQIPKSSTEVPVHVQSNFLSQDTHRSRKVQIYTVRDIHRSAITSLVWSSNGMKLFSGDGLGIVAETQVDFCAETSTSFKILEEEREIVQLSYSKQTLLVSSTQRTFLYSSKTRSVTKVGAQDRKSEGPFGGVFAAGLWSKNMKLYAARPGLRLWLADQEGVVQNTVIFKDLIKNSSGLISLINPAPSKIEAHNCSLEKQFSVLHNFMGKYIVTSHNNVLYVIDPVNVKVISVCSQLRSILSLDVHKDEIFVIETNRNIVRISVKPEEVVVQENNYRGMHDSISSLKPDFRIPDQPFKLIASKFKETSRALPKFNSSTIITTMRNVLEADLNIQDGYIPNFPIPMRAPPMELGELSVEAPHPISPEVQQYNSEEIEKFDKITKHSFQEVLLAQFKPERKKIRKRNGDAASSDSVSLSSQESSNSDLTASASPEKEKNFLSNSVLPIIHRRENGVNQQVINDKKRLMHELSETELRSKEEMLAKMLKWSELLPSFENSSGPTTRAAAPISEVSEHHSRSTNSHSQESSSSNTNSSDERDAEDGSYVKPSQTSANVSKTDFVQDKELSVVSAKINSVNNGLGVTGGASTAADMKVAETSGDFDNFPSIYDDYHSQSSSSRTLSNVNSNEFFGPPSGSSNVTLCGGSNFSATAIYRQQIPKRRSCEAPELHSLPSILPVQDMNVTGTVLHDYWIQYELPSSVTSLTCSAKYLICTDSQHSVFYSSLAQEVNELCWIKAHFQATQVTASGDGYIHWRIDPSGTLSALERGADPFMESNKWNTICDMAKYVVIGAEIGFILKTDNTLLAVRLDIYGGATPVETEALLIPIPLRSIHVLEDAIWALGVDGRVFYRSCTTTAPDEWCGGAWIEVKLNIPPVTAMSLGPEGSVWMVDIQNQISFVNDFIAARGKYKLWSVCISEELGNSGIAASTLQNSISQWTQKFTRWATAAPLQPSDAATPLLASCHTVVGFAIKGGNSVFLNKTCTSGHEWVPMALKSWKLKNICAGSIYHGHGYLWLEDIKGKIFYIQGGKGVMQPIDSPSSNIVTIATAPEALWVLDGSGTIFARCNINADNELGNGWDEIELSPIPDNRKLVHISCGSELVWSCDDNGGIYMRNGSLNPPSSTDISPAWISVEGSPNYGLDVIFTKVYVGPSDRIVFALDNRGGVYAREAVFPDLPIGASWVLIPSVEAISLAISETAVWALTPRGEIFRRSGISSTNFVGDSWKRIPGTAKVLTVSVCDEVWALDNNGTLLKHYVEELLHTPDTTRRMKALEKMSKDDDGDSTDWVLV